MHKISRLYIKLYIYFIVIVLIVIMAFPLVMFSNASPPPHVQSSEMIVSVLNLMMKYDRDTVEMERELKQICTEKNFNVALYNENGEVLFETRKSSLMLNPLILSEVSEKDVIFSGGILNALIKIDREEFACKYVYIWENFDFNSSTSFFSRLILVCITILLILYPLALHITGPLEKITQKAVRFSEGDFSALKKESDIKGQDEIAKLNFAFDNMADRLVAMIEEKKELISDISHELGSPLGRMQLAVDIIEDSLDNDEKPPDKIVKKLSKNIKEMSDLVDQLLTLSRMSKAYTLNIEPFDFEEIVKKTIQKFQHILDEDRIEVSIKKEGHIHNVKGDRDKIERVIQNLFGNAADHTGKNTKIEIILEERGGHFSFTIKDEGPGIKKENAEKIFEPFFREDPSRNRKTGGTGLGLAIVRKIIDLHGGKIIVLNPGEKGAVIRFDI